MSMVRTRRNPSEGQALKPPSAVTAEPVIKPAAGLPGSRQLSQFMRPQQHGRSDIPLFPSRKKPMYDRG
jgi:hypothetical protein